jgi:predicted ATPase
MRYRRTVIIPDALRVAVLARIRLLDRADRDVVMSASVIGRRFAVAVLAATVACDATRVRSALERACELQLIARDELSCEHFAFRHALTRDIIYAELIAARLRPLHRRVTLALERRPDETGALPLEDLAHHSWAAGDLPRALRYNELAGDGACSVHAHADARDYYRRARAATPLDSPAYARLTVKLRGLDESEA